MLGSPNDIFSTFKWVLRPENMRHRLDVAATEFVFVAWLHGVLIEFCLVKMQLIMQGSIAKAV